MGCSTNNICRNNGVRRPGVRYAVDVKGRPARLPDPEADCWSLAGTGLGGADTGNAGLDIVVGGGRGTRRWQLLALRGGARGLCAAYRLFLRGGGAGALCVLLVVGVKADVGDVSHAVAAATLHVLPLSAALALNVVGFRAPQAEASTRREWTSCPWTGRGASPVALLSGLRRPGVLLGAAAGGLLLLLAIHIDLHNTLHFGHGGVLDAPPLGEHPLVLDAGQHTKHHVLVECHEVDVAQFSAGLE